MTGQADAGQGGVPADRALDADVRDAAVRAGWEHRICRRLTDTTGADGALARFDFDLPLPGIARIRLSASRL